jgi:hypothetical protein
MTAKADFEPQEWDLIAEGPPSAAMLVITSERGGTIRETFAMAKDYAHAREQHGQSELLDEIVGAKPHVDHTRYHSLQELHDAVLTHLREAMTLLRAKAQPQEVDDYRSFVVTLSQHVAGAHSEHGQAVDQPEQSAIESIESALA